MSEPGATGAPDVKVLAAIGDGHYAATLLTVFGEVLEALQEDALKKADQQTEAGTLTPETSYALLHEIGAYRRIKYRLRQKVTRGNSLRAAESVRQQQEDAGDRTPPVN